MTSQQGVSAMTETDVSGTCPVKYEVTSSYGNQKLRKSKNLLACTDSSTARSVFQGVPYASTSVRFLSLIHLFLKLRNWLAGVRSTKKLANFKLKKFVSLSIILNRRENQMRDVTISNECILNFKASI